MYQNIIEKDKKNYCIIDFHQRKMTLLSCNKTISIVQKSSEDFYHLNCLHSFRTEEKKPNFYEKFEEVCKNHKYCEEIVTKETR